MRVQALDQLSLLYVHEDDSIRQSASLVAGKCVALLSDDALGERVRQDLLRRDSKDKWVAAHGRTLVLAQVLRHCGPRLASLRGDVLSVLRADLKDDHPPLREAAVAGLAGVFVGALAGGMEEAGAVVDDVAGDVATALLDPSVEVRKEAAALVKRAAKATPAALRPHHVTLIPPLLESVKDTYVHLIKRRDTEGARLGLCPSHDWGMRGLPIFVSHVPLFPLMFLSVWVQEHPCQVRGGARDAVCAGDPQPARDAQ